MTRLSFACLLALALGGAAAHAQSVPVLGDANESVTQPGIAKPPTAKPAPPARLIKTQHIVSSTSPNQPHLPQIALHPTATIGSNVPIAGPGGSVAQPTGNQ